MSDGQAAHSADLGRALVGRWRRHPTAGTGAPGGTGGTAGGGGTGTAIRHETAGVGSAAAGGGREAAGDGREAAGPREVPLNAAQVGIWQFERLFPGTPVNNLLYRARLRGPVDVAALGRALAEVLRRHDGLRATVTPTEPPALRVHPAPGTSLATVDLRQLGEKAFEEAERRTRAAAEEPLDLTAGPLVRACLHLLADDDAMLLLVAHHLVVDGRSLGVILDELVAGYAALAAGRSPDLPPPAALADQPAGPDRATRDRCLKYWRERLAGLPALELPLDRPRPATPGFRTGFVPVALEPELTAALRALAAAERTTVFGLLTAALQLLLARVCRQDDVMVGTPAAHGVAPGEHRVAPQVTMLALRAGVRREQTFRRFLAEVRDGHLAALAHRELPLDDVLRDPEVCGARPGPPFPVLLTLLPLAGARPGGAPLDVEMLAAGPAAIQGDLELYLWQAGEGLSGVLGYDAELFDRATADRFAEQFRVLVAVAVAAPDARIGDLRLISGPERHRLDTFGRGPALAVPDTRVAELFGRQAAATPDAVAVRHASGDLTYGDLDRRANRLARHLVAHGVGPESVVAVCLPRVPELLVAVLAVLKAGAAYLPLDPGHPGDRLSYILADSRADHLVVHTTTPGGVPAGLPVTDLGRPLPDHPDGPLPTTARAGNLAYVIYTSGSTGRPKGVAITQHSLTNVLLSTAQAEGFGAEGTRTVAGITTASFDIAAVELFLPLIQGGRIALLDRYEALDPELLAARLDETGATLVQATPVTWTLLLNTGWRPRHPVTALSGGERLTPELAARLGQIAAHAWNGYGPSETAIYSTRHRIDPDVPVSIGGPVHNTWTYVLDDRLQPVPVGVTGELFIGGDGVGRGYLHQPALTAERFLPDPYRAGARMYRTGDLVQWRADGRLDYLGRIDNQVKIRGNRIEINEIQSVLRGHPDVRDVAVIAVPAGPQAGPGELALAGYAVAADPGRRPGDRELRAYVLDRLPPVMVPSTFAWLDKLPVNPHGKVDLRALSALPAATAAEPTAAEPTAAEPAAAPADPVARALYDICAELLERPRVDGADNFFASGGHSLLVLALIGRVRAVLGVELAAREVFTAPVLADLAALIRGKLAGPAARPVPPPTAGERTGPAPLSYTQQRLWFIDQMAPGSAVYNMPAALRLRGWLDVAALTGSIDAVVRRHEVLRTTFPVVGDLPVQQVHPFAPLVVEMVTVAVPDGVDAAGHLAGELAARAATPFDLAAGPLIRVTLFRVGPEEHLLLLVLHHTVADWWSLGVLAEEISAGYAARTAGEPDPVAPPPIQFPDVAVWQRAHLDPASLGEQLRYWTRRLADPPVLQLPTDRPRPTVQSFVGASLPWELDPETTDAVRAVCRTADGTLFMVLLSAFGLLLGARSHATDVVVGTPVHGRGHPETERLIGFFANTRALRLDLSGDPSFTELVQRSRQVCVDAYAHDDVPFETLVDALRLDRDPSRNPLVEVVLTLQTGAAPVPHLTGLETELVEVGTGTAKFDLHLSVWEDAGGLRGTLEYRSDLFDESTADRLGADLRRLLRAVAADPAARLSTLVDPGTAALRPAQLPTAAAVGGRVGGAVAGWADRQPAAVAVSAGDVTLTYQALDARAGQLADLLRERGVRAGDRVGLRCGRSPEWTVGLLAILRVGAVCVPLDPAAGAGEEPVPALAEYGIEVDPAAGAVALRDDSGLALRLAGMRLAALVDPGDRLLARAGAATAPLASLLAWIGGATAVLAGDGETPPHTVRLTETTATTTASKLPTESAISTVPAAGEVSGARTLCLGATPPPPGRTAGPVVFQPTVTVPAHATRWTGDPAGRWSGGPVSGVEGLLLDRFARPVPTGAAGHLYVAGALLAECPADVAGPEAAPLAGADGTGPWYPTGLIAREAGDGALDLLGTVAPVRDHEPARPAARSTYTAPRTAVEEVLVRLWSDLLPDQRVGVHDNFFELGGHSLLATQLIARLRAVFQITVPIRSFFEQPTAAGVAEVVVAHEARPGQAEQIAAIWKRIKAGTPTEKQA